MHRAKAACVALCAFAALLTAAPSKAETTPIDRAVVVTSSAARPAEVDFGNASAVTLPDNWRRSRTGFNGVAWYAIALDEPLRATGGAGPAGELVLVVPRLADTGDFWLNGERLDLGAGNGFTRNRTLWVPLAAHALRPTGNLLQVRVSGTSDARGGLSRMELGPAAALAPGFEMRYFLQTTAPMTLMFAVPICLFGAIPLWLKTRRYIDLIFVLLCLSWMPRGLVLLSPAAGAPGPSGLLFALGSTFVSNTLLIILLLEHNNWTSAPWKRYLQALYGIIGLSFAAGIAAYVTGHMRPSVLGMLHWPYIALTVVPVLAQVRQAWQTRGRFDIFMAATLLAWYLAVLHDLAIAADQTPFDSFFLAPLSALFVLATLVARTVRGLALRRASAEHEISRAVADASSAHGQALEQMRAEFDRTKAAERQAVLAAERTRLLHDLHDGMGSQLITALRMVRRDNVPRDEVAKVIEDSLEDIRLIIDSLDLEERDLLPLLGNLRYRLEPRLNAMGVALHWDIELLPELDYLSPETGLNIVRIVQEAVNNAVRHGAAGNITVRVRASDRAIELSVTDDGCGFEADSPLAPGSRRGLGAMRARGRKLGGEVHIASSPAGTQVILTLPLER